VRLFEGAPVQRPDGVAWTETGFALVSENSVVGNRLALTDDGLLANLQQVQTDPGLHNGTPIPVSPELGSRDFSVEMVRRYEPTGLSVFRRVVHSLRGWWRPPTEFKPSPTKSNDNSNPFRHQHVDGYSMV
jgi:hypothetical protein